MKENEFNKMKNDKDIKKIDVEEYSEKMNERITENIVRAHFNKYLDIIEIDEQKSKVPKIDKLLKTASKKGGGQGYPEFIITFKDNTDFIIVIECKADIKKHESKNRDKYSDYAIDGVLLYASYLSKEYDVLAIAISGEKDKDLKVSHFLQIKGNKEAKEILGDKLLPPEDYLKGYLGSDQKLSQDYNSLLDFSRKLNQELHTLKIAESKRSLLISCILIALENKAFKKAYKEYDVARDLAKYLVNTTINKLEKANIRNNKLEDLKIEYSFIKTETSLSTEKDVLKNLIEEIDNNINKFVRTHKYYDVLGQFYIEFLRYANSDKGLGIVLTPPHITELFAELAQVNKDSVVYDNCCGTGGFLISAMGKMIKGAKGDSTKIKDIKTKQIIGVEYQPHIFALGISNMYIHQDGKTNIIKGDCFNEQIQKEVKKFNPNIGFLNPPYKADKKNDREELEFVLNNLESLHAGGTCIAIVPMQGVLAQKGKVYELKKKLLDKHTLEAVLSMPNELFFNSKTNVIAAIMIFTAHKPHPKNKETYFGYYKDDLFVKRKNKGRIDPYRKWGKIKEKWVTYYLNRKEEPGFSVNKVVTAKDEWCAEAYMETDLSNLSDKDFIRTIRNYLSFFIKEGRFDLFYSFINQRNIKKELNIQYWEYFAFEDLFEVKKGKRITKFDMEKGDTYFVSSSEFNNAVTGKIQRQPIFKGDTLTVNYDGSVAESFYQPFSYWALDSVNVLEPKFDLNVYIGLFIATVIRQEKYRFNYGRKWGQRLMEKNKIKLPTKNDGAPDFDFMENYIKGLPYSSSI